LVEAVVVVVASVGLVRPVMAAPVALAVALVLRLLLGHQALLVRAALVALLVVLAALVRLLRWVLYLSGRHRVGAEFSPEQGELKLPQQERLVALEAQVIRGYQRVQPILVPQVVLLITAGLLLRILRCTKGGVEVDGGQVAVLAEGLAQQGGPSTPLRGAQGVNR
jgi:hypothetical protein